MLHSGFESLSSIHPLPPLNAARSPALNPASYPATYPGRGGGSFRSATSAVLSMLSTAAAVLSLSPRRRFVPRVSI